MKRTGEWYTGMAVAVAIIVAVAVMSAWGQTPAPKAAEPTMEEKYLTSEIGRVNGEFRTFQQVMANVAAAHPDFREEIQKCIEDVMKRLQVKMKEMQDRLDAIKKK